MSVQNATLIKRMLMLALRLNGCGFSAPLRDPYYSVVERGRFGVNFNMPFPIKGTTDADISKNSASLEISNTVLGGLIG